MPEDNLNSVEKKNETSGGGWSITRIAVVASIVFIVLILLPFVVGIAVSLADIQNGLEIIRLIRDIFIIILSMVSIIIAVSIAVLIIQLAGLFNLLQHDIKPILEDLQATMSSARGTVKFIGDNVTEPIVRAGGFMAGLSVFIREVGGIRRALRRRETRNDAKESSDGK